MARDKNSDGDLLSTIEERSDAYKQQLIDRGELVPGSAFGIPPAIVEEMLTADRLFTIDFHGTPFFPAFFDNPGLDIKILGDLCQSLGPVGGAAKWQFFNRPKNSLAGKSPIDSLRAGENLALVKRAALIFTES